MLAHKQFVFGGDSYRPAASVAYAAQAGAFFIRALQAEAISFTKRLCGPIRPLASI
jgi:hypothetical protein